MMKESVSSDFRRGSATRVVAPLLGLPVLVPTPSERRMSPLSGERSRQKRRVWSGMILNDGSKSSISARALTIGWDIVDPLSL